MNRGKPFPPISLKSSRARLRAGALLCFLLLATATTWSQESWRLPGEYEKQDALLIGCHELVRDMPNVFSSLVGATHGRVPLVALVNDADELRLARHILKEDSRLWDHVSFVQVPHDTMWARDYGPLVVRRPNGDAVLLDAVYDSDRPLDDRVPTTLASRLSKDRMAVPLPLEGGNLLTNGRGLAIVAGKHWIEEDFGPGGKARYVAALKHYYGFDDVLVLESLIDEPTGHVDMFATFTSADTILVGSYREDEDPDNAAVLNRNAASLQCARTSGGPLKVHRIPMPPRDGELWRSYTNAVYVNGAVLVPVYPGVDPSGRRVAMETFRRALPGWDIIGMDASDVIQSGGAFHCLTMNLGPIGPLPNIERDWDQAPLEPPKRPSVRLAHHTP